MDHNNWRASQGQIAPGPPQGQVGGGEVSAVPNVVTPPAAMDGGDWRSQLQADSRQRIVNKIMDTLTRHLPFFSEPEGLQELKKIAIRFEQKIYTAATSQSDYLRKISMKMLTMETKSQNHMANSLQSNAANTGNNPPDQVHGVQSQIQNLQLSMTSQSQPRQQLIPQNMQANMTSAGVQSCAILTSTLPNSVNLSQGAMLNVIGQNPNLQNMSSVAQNPIANSMGQGIPSNVFMNSQRLLAGRQQQVVPQQQHSQNAQTYIYQQQFQNHQLMKQKFQQGGMAQSLMQQQNFIQPSQIQTSQQGVLQPSVMQSSSLSSLQQNQQPSVQQVTQPGLHQQSQSVLKQQQQQQQQASLLQQQQTSISQQTLPQAPQQQQLQQMIGQQSTATNIQHNQLIDQPNSIPDVQQQQQRLMGQQNNMPNLQQQQQLMGQQNSLSNMQLPQMGPQGNVSGLHQQPMLGTQSGNTGMQANQHSMHMQQQSKVPVQQQMQQNAMTSLPSQNQLSQQEASKQQMISHFQSQPVPLQHLPQQSNPLQRDNFIPSIITLYAIRPNLFKVSIYPFFKKNLILNFFVLFLFLMSLLYYYFV